MPTGTQTAEDKAWVEAQGYSVAVLDKDRAREDWYRPDGLRIPALPVDGYHRSLYREKGWTLRRPSPAEAKVWTAAHPEAALKIAEARVAAPLPMELEKEIAEVTRPLAKPPKHLHVYAAGSPLGAECMVLGCRTTKTEWKGIKGRKAKKVKEAINGGNG